MDYHAVHLPGGNGFDDVRLDLEASYAEQERWLAELARRSAKRSRFGTTLRRAAYRFEPYRVREALVNLGLRRQWFEEFREYWERVVQGRPLTVMDFHNLRFAYRRGAQYGADELLSWETWTAHLANWQQPKNLFQTFDFVYRSALHPAWAGRMLFGVLEPNWRVLEYGCAAAPMYRTWRTFLAHVPTQWMLADIPGFAFHYARHVYGRDSEVGFAVIDNPDDPLRAVDGEFDLIILQTVFEHLDRPQFVARYLLDRLRPGGLFWFDYPVTDTRALNTPAGQEERRATLEYLSNRVEVVRGELRIDDSSVGQCIARKRA